MKPTFQRLTRRQLGWQHRARQVAGIGLNFKRACSWSTTVAALDNIPDRASLIVLFAVMAIAQDIKQTSILLGTVDLTLGMPQQLVLNRLADQFDVRKYDDSNWFVYPKGRSASSLGTLVFTDQKLSAVFKDWGTNEQKASQLVIALYDVISGMLEAEKGRQSAAS